LKFFKEEIGDGILSYIKFDVIFYGNGPHKPSDRNDKTFIFESFAKTVKRESIFNREFEFQETGIVF
jgi:hypothetical protein